MPVHRPPIGLSCLPFVEPATNGNAMTRFSGIRVLASSLVLWALAAWIFGSPDPAGPETVAEAVQETTPDPGTGMVEGVRADAVAIPASPDPVMRDSTPSPSHDAGSGSASSRAGTTHAVEPRTAPITSPARTVEGRTPPAVPATAGDGSQTAHAPIAPPAATGEDPAATIATAPRAATAAIGGAGAPIASPVSPAPNVGSRQGDAAGIGPYPPDAGAPSASVRSAPWLAPSMPRSPLPPGTPARPGGAAADGGAVAAQIDAARRAAWEGRLADALVHYRAAARVRPKSHVVWGEMGNVLWAMGRWPEAAYALEGAATLLVGAGELRAANALLPAVRNIDPNAAHRIQQRLWAASRRPQG